MSKEDNLNQNDFKLVSHKKISKKYICRNRINENLYPEHLSFDKSTAIRRVLEAKSEIVSSDFYSSIIASLREGIQNLGTPTFKTIVCFGLGKITECMISRYQLALLICLKDVFDAYVYCYDPIFSENELDLLNNFDIQTLPENIEGKYKATEPTLFFLPHCPKQLSNNLLWSNWGLDLSNCIIISNSFNTILETNSKRIISESANYLLNISPYVIELAVINSFKYFEIFNDTAIHIFPLEKLKLISKDFWNDCKEPTYLTEDIEFITNKLSNSLFS